MHFDPALHRRQKISERLRRFRINDISLATCSFHTRFLVAKASLTQVYWAKLYDGSMVMIKRAWPGDRYWDGQRALENERHILSSCKGKYLLNLVGVSDDTPERILVLEHGGNGCLYDALHHDCHGGMSWPNRIQIAYQVAVAIRGLHSASSQIVHRDVRSTNVWIDSQGNAKLGGFEFGMRASSKMSPSLQKCPSKAMATIDPDYQSAAHLCAKTDVFCFGVLLLEIISGRKAIAINNSPPFVVDWALPVIRKDKALILCDPKIKPPFQNLKVVLEMARIAARCVNRVCSRRPTMAVVAEELKMLTLKISLIHKEEIKNVHTLGQKLPGMDHKDQMHLTSTDAHRWDSHLNLPNPLRSQRPSMLFGLIAPKTIPLRSNLEAFEDATNKAQREPLLPSHLRHEFS